MSGKAQWRRAQEYKPIKEWIILAFSLYRLDYGGALPDGFWMMLTYHNRRKTEYAEKIMLFLLAACLPLAAPALAEGGERPQIILMACYQQVGWGVYADAAFLDEEGGIWHYENEMGLPRRRRTAGTAG